MAVKLEQYPRERRRESAFFPPKPPFLKPEESEFLYLTEKAISICAEELKFAPSRIEVWSRLVTDIGQNTGKEKKRLRHQLESQLLTTGDYLFASCLIFHNVQDEEKQTRDLDWVGKRFKEFLEVRLGAKTLLPTVPATVAETKALIRIASLQGEIGIQTEAILTSLFDLPNQFLSRLKKEEESKAEKVRKKRQKRRQRETEGETRTAKDFSAVVDFSLEIGYRYWLAMVELEEKENHEAARWGINFWVSWLQEKWEGFGPPLAIIAAEVVDDKKEDWSKSDNRITKANSNRFAFHFLLNVYPPEEVVFEELERIYERKRASLIKLQGTDKDLKACAQRGAKIALYTDALTRWNESVTKFLNTPEPLSTIATSLGKNELQTEVVNLLIRKTKSIAQASGAGGIITRLPDGLSGICVYWPTISWLEVKEGLKKEIFGFSLSGRFREVVGSIPRPELGPEEVEWILSLFGPSWLEGKLLRAYQAGLGQAEAEQIQKIQVKAGDQQARDKLLAQIQESGGGLGAKVEIPIAEKFEDALWGMTAIELRPTTLGRIKARIHFGVCHFDFQLVPDLEQVYVAQGLKKMGLPYRILLEKVIFAHLAHLLKPRYQIGKEPLVVGRKGERISLATEKGRRLIHGGAHFRALPVGHQPDTARFSQDWIVKREEAVFGEKVRVEQVDEGIVRTQQDLARLAKFPKALRDRIIGRLKAIMIRGERARFLVCQGEEKGRQREVIRLCLLKPEEVFNDDFIGRARRRTGKEIKVVRAVSEQDFEKGGVLAGCHSLKNLIEFQQQLEGREMIVSPLHLSVFWGTKCFYRVTIVVEEERRIKETYQVECPGVMRELISEAESF